MCGRFKRIFPPSPYSEGVHTGMPDTAQDCLPSTWICQRYILQCTNAPCVVLFSHNSKNQRVDFMRTCRMGETGYQSTPEMNDYCSVGDLDNVNQLILERGVAVDRFVDGCVKCHDSATPRT